MGTGIWASQTARTNRSGPAHSGNEIFGGFSAANGCLRAFLKRGQERHVFLRTRAPAFRTWNQRVQQCLITDLCPPPKGAFSCLLNAEDGGVQ